jgi:hypothetical protein
MKTIKPKFHNQYSWKFNPKLHTETVLGKSLTVPDEAYTIKELLHRHTNGIDMSGIQKMPIYDEEVTFDTPDFQKIHNSDLTDKNLFLEETKLKMKEISHRNQLVDSAEKESNSNNSDDKNEVDSERSEEKPK